MRAVAGGAPRVLRLVSEASCSPWHDMTQSRFRKKVCCVAGMAAGCLGPALAVVESRAGAPAKVQRESSPSMPAGVARPRCLRPGSPRSEVGRAVRSIALGTCGPSAKMLPQIACVHGPGRPSKAPAKGVHAVVSAPPRGASSPCMRPLCAHSAAKAHTLYTALQAHDKIIPSNRVRRRGRPHPRADNTTFSPAAAHAEAHAV